MHLYLHRVLVVFFLPLNSEAVITTDKLQSDVSSRLGLREYSLAWAVISSETLLSPCQLEEKTNANNCLSFLRTRHGEFQNSCWSQSIILHTCSHNSGPSFVLLNGFRCVHLPIMVVSMAMWWQALFTWSKPYTAGDDASQISGSNVGMPAQYCALYMTAVKVFGSRAYTTIGNKGKPKNRQSYY